MRLYAVYEATQGLARLHNRRSGYAADRNFAAGHTVGPVCPEWFAGWENLGIDMLSNLSKVASTGRTLRSFATSPARHPTYWFDDVNFDWEACREYGCQIGLEGLPTSDPPSAVWRLDAHADI